MLIGGFENLADKSFMRHTADLVVMKAAINPRFYLSGFRPALAHAERELRETIMAEAFGRWLSDAHRKEFEEEFQQMIWSNILECLDDIVSGKIVMWAPTEAWKREAERIGIEFGKLLVMNGPMNEGELKELSFNLDERVRARSKEITDGWPLHDETRKQIVDALVSAAQESVKSFSFRVFPAEQTTPS